MQKIITCGIFFCIVHKAISEEFSCGNKCYGQGVVSRSCQCDIACNTVYKDCCSDSKFLDRSYNFKARSLTCKSNTLVVNSCLKEWKGPDFIINSCKMSYNYEMDPVGNSPVTSEVTGVTYSNYYCAICNGDAENVIMWNIKMSCPLPKPNLSVNKEEAFKSIFYRYTTNKWEYVTPDNVTKKPSFQGCAINSEIPQEHESKLRRCESNEVRTCVTSWKKDAIREMCGTYTDPVYSNGTTYKNFYCAVCNRVDMSTISCGDAISSRNNLLPDSTFPYIRYLNRRSKRDFDRLYRREPYSVLLLRVSNFGTRKTECSNIQTFDPFAKRCRNIVCGIPGYVMQDGRCKTEVQPPVDFEKVTNSR